MDKEKIINKFGNDYCTDDYSFIMGIDFRFANHLAQRFANNIVMEICSGAVRTTKHYNHSTGHTFRHWVQCRN